MPYEFMLFFPGDAAEVNTSTAFIGLDSPSNQASITMGFHGDGWLGGKGRGKHGYQLGVYARNERGVPRPHVPLINTTVDISRTFNTYGLLWTPTLVEWRFNGEVVARYANASNIPYQHMQLRLHTRSGYCGIMPAGASFNATFKSFAYNDVSVPAPVPAPAARVSVN